MTERSWSMREMTDAVQISTGQATAWVYAFDASDPYEWEVAAAVYGSSFWGSGRTNTAALNDLILHICERLGLDYPQPIVDHTELPGQLDMFGAAS